MTTTWRNGLQKRLKALEDEADVLEITRIVADEVQVDNTLTALDAFIAFLGLTQLTTPVNAVAATATTAYVNATNMTAGKLITINGKAYKFVAVVAVEGDVKIGASADATMLNLSRAINSSGGTPGDGNDYIAAIAHPTVGAALDSGTDTLTLTARTKGAAGNDLTLTTDEATFTLSGATLGSGAGVDGVDGTVGSAGDIRLDTGYLYVCSAANTVSGTNWVRTALTTF
jgi:hypothetical protein